MLLMPLETVDPGMVQTPTLCSFKWCREVALDTVGCGHLLYLSRAVLFSGPSLSLGRGRSPTLEAAPGPIGSLGPGPWRFDCACFDDMSVVTTAPALGVPGLFPGRVDSLHTHLIGQVSRRVHGHPVGRVVGPDCGRGCGSGGLTLCPSLEGDIRVCSHTPCSPQTHCGSDQGGHR